MKKILYTSLLIASTASAQTSGQANIGGQITNTGSSETSNITITDRHQDYNALYEFGNTYQRSSGKTSINIANLDVKQNFDFNRTFYSISEIRYDYNQLRNWKNAGVVASGLGIRLYTDKNLRVSNEVSGGIRFTDFGHYPVARDTFWVRYNRNKLSLYSKWLYERSDISYYQEQSGINLIIYKSITLGVSHQYQKDIKTVEITSFNIGLKF